jgi:ParB-like chromosome segregation protein Spo0J
MISFDAWGEVVMVAVVIVLNLLIGVGCLVVARRVWKLRSALSKAADALISAERATDKVLSGAPRGIGKGETGVRSLRRQYQNLEVKLLRVQQILKLLGLGQLVWQWYGKRYSQKLPLLKQRASSKTVLGKTQKSIF